MLNILKKLAFVYNVLVYFNILMHKPIMFTIETIIENNNRKLNTKTKVISDVTITDCVDHKSAMMQ